MLKKYKWDANSANNFQNALELPTICKALDDWKSQLHNNSHTNINSACDKLTHIINQAARISLKLKPNKKTTKTNKTGFDYEYNILKQHTIQLGKLVQNFPKIRPYMANS